MTQKQRLRRKTLRIVCHFKLQTLLTLGYSDIINASLDVTEEELQRLRGDTKLERKLYKSPLRDLILSLVDMLETDSEESQHLEKEKHTTSPVVLYNLIEPADANPPPSTPQMQPAEFPLAPTNKRKISNTSFGTRSTETTPTKLLQPEAKVQSLQNTFVKIIINTLWLGKVDVPWVKGRHMFLTYTESPHVLHNTYNRTNNTSFQYTLCGSVDQILIGRVRAIADGALRLKTNKLKDPKKYGVWSKQRCALAFEVSTPPFY